METLKTDMTTEPALLTKPYKDDAANFMYNLLFCDDLRLYKKNAQEPYSYPFDVLFAEKPSAAALQAVIDDVEADPRMKLLAYNKQAALNYPHERRELLAVIVEVALEEGLDTLAAFSNGTARYINQSEKILVWENNSDENPKILIEELFQHSRNIVDKIGRWEAPRKAAAAPGNVRISFLVSDGLYFGEGPINMLFGDPMAAPALTKATELLQYITAPVS